MQQPRRCSPIRGECSWSAPTHIEVRSLVRQIMTRRRARAFVCHLVLSHTHSHTHTHTHTHPALITEVLKPCQWLSGFSLQNNTVCTRTHLHTHIRTHAHTHTRTHAHTHIHTHTHTHTHMRAHTYTYKHTHTHTHTQTNKPLPPGFLLKNDTV